MFLRYIAALGTAVSGPLRHIVIPDAGSYAGATAR